jgi:hypothetical protein
MKERIGKTAGQIWHTLQQQEQVSISRLPKLIGEKDAVVYQALGWLAREDKIEYEQKSNRTLVSIR